MTKRHIRKSAPSYEILLPQPSPGGVAKVRAMYFTKTGKAISEEQARDVLYRVMRFQYLNIIINSPCSDSDFTPENPTTTEG